MSVECRPSERSASEARWYVVHTQPHNEGRAAFHLQQQGYRTFCPSVTRTVRHARQTTQKNVPLFPNYIFVALDVSRDRWHCINGSRGVVRLVTQGDAPLALADGVVEQLRANAHGTMERLPEFYPGQALRIVRGPFADLIGRLDQLDGAGRVRILLELLTRSVAVTMRREWLEPAA